MSRSGVQSGMLKMFSGVKSESESGFCTGQSTEYCHAETGLWPCVSVKGNSTA